MGTEQSMTKLITQAAIKVTKVAIMVVREEGKQVSNATPIHTIAR